jgi:hypothetical protein
MAAGKSVIKILIDGDTSGLDQALGKTSRNIGSMVADASKKFAIFSAALGGAAIVVGKQLVDAASDLNEVTSKTEVIFGDAASGVIDFASEAAKALGQSKTDALAAASSFGVFGKAAGLTGQDLGKFSTDMVALASDLASFSNTSPEDAALALGAALRGESEPIRAYGVMLDDATLKAKAMELGIYDGNGALTQQQKVLAAQAAIMEQTTDAQGDFARTQGGMANQSRILSARMEDLKARLGQALLPIALRVVTVFGQIIDKVGPLAEEWMPKFAKAIQDGAARITPLARAIGDFLAPHLERIGDWIKNNTATVKVFFAVIAGLAVVAGVIALGSALASLLNPIGLIVVAIAALVAGFQYAYTNFEGFRNAVDATIQFVKNVVETFVAIVKSLWKNFGDEIIAVARAAWGFVQAYVERVVAIVRGVVSGFVSAVTYVWSRWGEEIKATASAAWDGIRIYIETVLNVIKGIISTVTAVIKGDWSGAWQAIKDTVKAGIDGVVEFVKTIGPRVASVASGAWDSLKNGFVNAINFIIRKWNGLEFKVPGFNVPGIGKIGGVTVGVPDIPLLATGGIVTRPTLAVVGEAGPEAVIPLNRAGGMLAGTGGNTTVNIYTNADPNSTKAALRRFDRRNGPGI